MNNKIIETGFWFSLDTYNKSKLDARFQFLNCCCWKLGTFPCFRSIAPNSRIVSSTHDIADFFCFCFYGNCKQMRKNDQIYCPNFLSSLFLISYFHSIKSSFTIIAFIIIILYVQCTVCTHERICCLRAT